MRGDPQVDLPGAVLVGRRFARGERVPSHSSAGDAVAEGETVTIPGIILRIGSDGLTVVGPKPDVVHNVLWQRVKSVEVGENSTFEDGSPARSIDVELDDRKVCFLVPVAVLTGERRRILNEIAREHLGPVGVPGPGPELQPPAQVVVNNAPAPAAVLPVEDPVEGTVEGTVLLAMPVSEPEPVPEQMLVTGSGWTSPAKLVLPPPPPRSDVAMPPSPKDARESASAAADLTGGGRSGSAGQSQQTVFFLPLAVPPARRVQTPGQVPGQPGSAFAGFNEASDLPKVPSRLPPPPPRGSSSHLPPKADGSDARESDARQSDARQRTAPGGFSPEEPRPSEPAPVAVPFVGPSTTAPVEPSRTVPGQDPEPRSSTRRDRTKRRRTTLLASGLVLVLAVAGGTVFGLSVTDPGRSATPTTGSTIGPSTRNSSGGEPGALTGPASGADAPTVAGALNIVASGLLASWQPGHAPWSRVATAEANSSLARCLGLPVSHIGALVGIRQPDGPRVYTSGWISDGSGNAGFESMVELNRAVATQQSDMAALDLPGAASCLQGWFGSLDVSDDAIVGVPSVKALTISVGPGERAAGFGVSVSTRTGSTQENVHEEVVILGGGRVEVGLVSESIGGILSPSFESSELTGIESRLRTVAGS